MQFKHLFFLACVLLSSCSKPDYIDSDAISGKFSDHHGQWVVINYWATWCKPCIEEIPELNRLAAQEKNRVVVFGVDFMNSQGEELQQAINQLGIEFKILTQDPSHLLGYKPPTVLPTTLIFNPKGELHQTLFGPQTIQSLLGAMAKTSE